MKATDRWGIFTAQNPWLKVSCARLPPSEASPFSWWAAGAKQSERSGAQAARDGVLEEILVLGYLLRRLGQLGLSPAWAIAISAVVRGSYHLYQGFGGFLGNAVMGVIFAVLYLRWKRVTPFIIAHGLIDTGAFVGYAVLHGHVSWLP